MTVLVTGVAGFIGCEIALALLARGQSVLGVDNLNDYYDPKLKRARLARLEGQKGFAFHRLDIADKDAVAALLGADPEIEAILHLAAQAGVRYSLTAPWAYLRSNIDGQLALLEAARHLPKLRHLVYASSSSVYGASRKLPFALEDPCDRPQSLYGATKRAGELMASSYAKLYGIPCTGLRYFTVYGPWGRPDMAPIIFAEAILSGGKLRLFNEGNLARDFTYIDDIVAGSLAALDRPPSTDAGGPGRPHRLFNLGNHRPEALRHFLSVLEEACGAKAEIELAPMQAGDVLETYADISASTRELGFAPTTRIEEGLPRFVDWYRRWRSG